MSLKQNRILKMTFVESQFGIMWVYEFQTKANSYEDNDEWWSNMVTTHV